MKQKVRANLKDKILKTLVESEKKSFHSEELAKLFKIEHFIILGLGEELFLEELILKIGTTSTTQERAAFIYKILPKGIYFIKEDGGFKLKYWNSVKKNIWNITKIIAAVLNAVVIICISIWATKTSVESNELKKEILKKDSQIQHLMIKNEKHQFDSTK